MEVIISNLAGVPLIMMLLWNGALMMAVQPS
jgi:hypothetical protein